MTEPEDLSTRESLVVDGYATLNAIDSSSSGPIDQAEGLRVADDLIHEFGLDDWQPTRTWIARIRLKRAVFMARLEHSDRALASFDEVVQVYALSTIDEEREVAADALLTRASLCEALGRTDDELATLHELVDRFADENHLGIQQSLALTQRRLVEEAKTWESTVDTFDALERAHGEESDGLRSWAVLASSGYYVKALVELGRDDEADAAVKRLWERYRDTSDLRCRRALTKLRLLAPKLLGSATVAAEAAEVIEWLAPYEAEEPIIEVAAEARVQRAGALRANGEPESALAVVNELLAKFADTADADTFPHLAWAQVEQGLLLEELGRSHEALASLRSTRRFLDTPGDSGFLRLKVAQALDHAANILAADTSGPVERGQGADRGALAREQSPVEQRPMSASEVAYADGVAELAALFDTDPDPAVQRLVSTALYTLADHQSQRLHTDAALTTYDRLSRCYGDASDPEIAVTVAKGMMNTGTLHMERLEQFADALEAFNALLHRYRNHTSPAMRDILAFAASARAVCANQLTQSGRVASWGHEHEPIPPAELEAAERWQDEAIDAEQRGQHAVALATLDRILNAHIQSEHPEWRRRCLDAFARKAWSLKKMGRAKEAIAMCDEAVTRYGADLSLEMEKDIATMLSYKAVELDKLGRHDEEITVYDDIIRRWSTNRVPDLRKRVSNARLNKGITLLDLGQIDEAIRAFQEAVDHANDKRVDIAIDGVVAANQLGVLLRNTGRAREAIEAHDLALRHTRRDDQKLQAQAGAALVGMGRAHAALGQSTEAIDALDRALALPPGALKDNLKAAVAHERAELERKKQPTGLFRRLFPGR